MNPNDWKQSGRVSIWTYQGNPRSYRGWHLNCDEEGAGSLADLVSALAGAPEPSRRTVIITKPTQRQLAVPNCSAKPRSPQKFVLTISADWSITEAEDLVVLGFPGDMAGEIETGLQALLRCDGDYNVGTEGSELWFWWSE